MCVIAVQKKTDRDLTYSDIFNMCSKNPDGFGLMWNTGKQCLYKKGYFDVEKFYDDYIDLRKNPKVNDIALHMRIGTGSNIDVANCHPFPITSVKKRIKSSHGSCDVGIMMNGIIGDSTAEFSDTALYTMNILKPWYDTDKRFYKHFSRKQKTLFENEICGCRFVFMDKDNFNLFGKGWSTYEDKAEVSNKYWMPFNFYHGGYYYSSYTDYDDDFLPWSDYVSKKAKRFSTKNNKRHKSYIDYLEEGVI